jgi:glc operon protein GlcG
MIRLSTLSIVLALGLGLGPAAIPARAQFDDPKSTTTEAPASTNSEIRDPAGLFSREAIREALARLVTIERMFRVPTTIETVESLRGESIDDATIRLAKRLGPQAKGIFILISKGDRKAEVIASRDNTALTPRPRRLAIRDAFLDEFRKGDYDLGLKRGVEAIEKTLASIRGEDAKPPASGATTTTVTTRAAATDLGFSTFVRRNQVKLTLSGAKRLVAAAETKAGEMGYKMNIAVVDDGGHLLAFSRMDDARPASANTAITKAVSAATLRQATGPLAGSGSAALPDILLNLSLQNAAAVSGGKITTLLGGVPVAFEGQVIGAIGVGGGTGEQDAEVAKAALAQFLADFPASATAPAATGTAK